MKKILVPLSLLFMVGVVTIYSQVPQAFNYQAVARDASGNLIANQAVGIQITLIQDSANGAVVYIETFTDTTNQFGLFTLAIGQGTPVSGTFSGITWNTGNYWLKIELDPAGGTSYTDMGTSQLLTVPFAMYAANAGTSGVTGATGPTGADGVNGTNGLTGATGPTGADGTNGTNGVTGATGTTGVNGTNGVTGAIGPTGANGNNGATGATGPSGGPAGPAGPTGATGNTNGWLLTGNAGTLGGINFIGTTDDIPFNIRVNNQKSGRIDPTLFNTFFGYQTGNSNTTGHHNTASGEAALFANTTGSYNTANGDSAISTNVAGSNATAIGTNAMQYANNTTTPFTNYNVAVGYEALRGSTTTSANTGNYNTALGYQTLWSNTIGTCNTASGDNVLYSNTAGEGNTANGRYALYSNTIGIFNTASGARALYSNVTGDYNTCIGYLADVSTGALTNATAIGYGATVTASNRIHIGNTSVTWIGGQVGWSTYSDKSLKKNITDGDIGLDFILKLKPKKYEYTAEGQKGIIYDGFVAQDVEEVLNELHTTFSGLCKPQNDKDYYSLRYAEFAVPLVKAVQELNEKNIELQKKIEQLKKDNEEMKAQIKLLQK